MSTTLDSAVTRFQPVLDPAIRTQRIPRIRSPRTSSKSARFRVNRLMFVLDRRGRDQCARGADPRLPSRSSSSLRHLPPDVELAEEGGERHDFTVKRDISTAPGFPRESYPGHVSILNSVGPSGTSNFGTGCRPTRPRSSSNFSSRSPESAVHAPLRNSNDYG